MSKTSHRISARGQTEPLTLSAKRFGYDGSEMTMKVQKIAHIYLYIPVVLHEAVSEISKGKLHINQKKHVPIRIDCDLLNTSQSMSTSHSISHGTLVC